MKSRIIFWNTFIVLVTMLPFIGCEDDNTPTPIEVNILKFEPSDGMEGDEISIKGNGFEQGIKVFFSENKEAEVVKVTANIVNVIVPQGAVTGPVKIQGNDGCVTTSSMSFSVTPAPFITAVSPSNVKMCDTLLITGANFRDDVKIFLSGNIEAPVVSVTQTEIKAIVAGGENGVLTLKIGNYSTTSPSSLIVDNTPVILSSSPGAVQGGDITLTGGFSTKTNDIKVIINNVEYDPKTISTFSLTVAVPNTLKVGDIGTIQVKNTALSKTSEKRTFKIYSIFDDFNRSDAEATPDDNPNPIGANWRIINYKWTLTNMGIEANTGGAMGFMIHNNAVCKGKFRVETDIIMRAEGTNDWAGIVLNYIDNNNFYMLRICGAAAQFIYMEEGTFDNAGYAGFPVDGGQLKLTGHTWYHIEISNTNETKKFRVKITQNDNGKVLFDDDVTDDKSQGSLWNNNGYAGYYFGNFGFMDNFGFSILD